MNKKDQQAQTSGQEDVVEAKGGAVAVKETTAVSAEVQVQGASLEFPFIRLAQGMSQWKAGGKKPVPGNWYIGKNKDSNVCIAEGGKDAGIYGIILGAVMGFKEERSYQPGNSTPPKRWIVAGKKEDGSPVTEADMLEAAAKEGYSLVPKETGEFWQDTGRPKMRANLGRFCYLMMLVPLPEDFESDEFRLVPIGDRLYTTARFEYDKQYFKQMDGILSNIRSRAEFAHRNEKDYKFTLEGLVGHIYSCEATSKSGVEYTSHTFEKATRNGKPWEFTEAEKADLVKFLMNAKATVANVNDAATDSEY